MKARARQWMELCYRLCERTATRSKTITPHQGGGGPGIISFCFNPLTYNYSLKIDTLSEVLLEVIGLTYSSVTEIHKSYLNWNT